MDEDQLYYDVYNLIYEGIKEFVKKGGDPKVAHRAAWSAVRYVCNDVERDLKTS